MVCKVGKPNIYLTRIFSVAFGFLGGKEVKERGLTNVGMHDRKCFESSWRER
jgi:hypothetical protein